MWQKYTTEVRYKLEHALHKAAGKNGYTHIFDKPVDGMNGELLIAPKQDDLTRKVMEILEQDLRTTSLGSNSQFPFNCDGSSTEIKIFSADNPTHVFILQPAMGVFAKYYQPLAETMVNTGFAVVLADLRGNDTSTIRPKRGIDFGYKEMLEQDFESVVNFVSEKYEPAHLSFRS